MIVERGHPFLIRQIAIYWPYHRDRLNWLIHVVAIPASALGVMIPMAWLELAELGGYGISPVTLIMVPTMIWWIVLDVPFGTINSLLYAALMALADRLAELPVGTGLALAVALFVGGWAVQFLGHRREDQRLEAAGGPPYRPRKTLAVTFATPNGRPVDALIQGAVVPMVVTGEALLRLGLRPELKRRIEAIAVR